ncbi:propionate catabolism operon regulatory protein PrpR [Wohlfahrtiimonas chitiniclastica]|uniref:propionate catabolism operon regulatory protein PrpR n=1 Tax=Wohlfahrtiimonas chitiniclastica TaxID=400946 RepID=UPI001BCFC949|nr:propionate catabolism operon regulatory protein PrpR [Wohlfahrtiimonas chitiniclastica]
MTMPTKTTTEKPIIWTVSITHLYETFQEMSNEFSEIAEITPIKQSFEEAVQYIRSATKEHHCDAIISAGSNGAYLKDRLSIPVINVRESGFDVMHALATAREISPKIGIINYRKPLPALEKFKQAFNIPIEERIYITRDDAKAAINELKRKGIGVIVGAGLITEMANAAGIPSVFLYSTETIREAFRHAIKIAKQSIHLRKNRLNETKLSLDAKYHVGDIKGFSPEIERVRAAVLLYSKTKAPTLIQGESGTGKELIAHAIHHEYTAHFQHKTGQQKRPFVAINCSAIPESLLESELFGYEEGAFTGSLRGGKAGVFEVANNGTLFLDEIGEMPLSLQNRLLRVLEEKSIVRVGGYHPIPVDVKIIAATHAKLDEWVKAGKFRLDLFYRLSVLRIFNPPLRKRGRDIILLAETLLKQALTSLNLPIRHEYLAALPKCDEALLNYHWPGNIRELRNITERIALYLKANPNQVPNNRMILDLSDERHIHYDEPSILTDPPLISEEPDLAALLKYFKGDKQAVANYLGISRTTLWRKMKVLNNHA